MPRDKQEFFIQPNCHESMKAKKEEKTTKKIFFRLKMKNKRVYPSYTLTKEPVGYKKYRRIWRF